MTLTLLLNEYVTRAISLVMATERRILGVPIRRTTKRETLAEPFSSASIDAMVLIEVRNNQEVK